MGDQEEEFHNKWKRRKVHAPLDMLHAFESGDFCDCTIRVGCDLQNPECSYKDFKCHRVILSARSPVFERMFLSHFKEAKMGPDDPISLDRIDPEVFETAMTFMYGAVSDFESVTHGIKVYKFAHEMQISSFMTGLVDFFNGAVQPSQIFAIFDLHKIYGNQLELNNCKEILREEESVALNSDEWLKISSESVEEFLKIEGIYANEVDLLKALIRWGIYQTKQDGDNFEDGESLRNKIMPGLQLIRFNSLTKEEFSGLCLQELGKVLSDKEKNSILISLTTGDWNLMPTQFASSKLAPRLGVYTMCGVKFERIELLDGNINAPINRKFEFKVNKTVIFAGLKISMSEKYHKSFQFKLQSSDDNKTIIGTSSQWVSNKEVEFLKISPSCKLIADKNYSLHITLDKGCRYTAAYMLDPELLANKQNIFDEAILEIITCKICAGIEALVFKKFHRQR